MKWIKSGGGPLVVMERSLVAEWFGVLAASETAAGKQQRTDYERACDGMALYLSTIEIAKRSGIVVGDVPMLTSAYTDDRLSAIVSIYYAPDRFDISRHLSNLDVAELTDPQACLSYENVDAKLVMFDAAIPGSQLDDDEVEFELAPGYHQCLSYLLEETPGVSLMLHRFTSLSA